MFNPYVSDHAAALRPSAGKNAPGPGPAILSRLNQLDSDDLLILLLIYLIARQEEEHGIWPFVAMGLYLML